MNLRNKSITLVDQLLETKSDMWSMLNVLDSQVVTLDPVRLFSESDWTRFEDDVDVINKVYSYVFDEVVIANKKLVCFWPLSEQFGSEWVELVSLCKANNYELEIYKSKFLDADNYGYSGEMLGAWKKFVFFLIESLLEDIELNQDLEEIATLTSGQDSIVLFKLEQQGETRYTFTFKSGLGEFVPNNELKLQGMENFLPEFKSFQDMLVKLFDDKDLSLYRTKFSDKQLEKTYFNVLAKKARTKNLIESWIMTYTLN